MAKEVLTCRVCGKIVHHLFEPCIWVKRGRWVYYYHEKCVKGGRKNDASGKRH